MKTKNVLLIAAMIYGGAQLSAQDLAPGINYAYNPPGANGIITSISVDAVENDGVAVGAFDVSMYLYDMSTSTPYVIGTVNVPSLSGYGVYSITNWTLDINNTQEIPAGTYRLGVWVDSNGDISESDENNNAGLLSGNINYTPSASGIAGSIFISNSVSLYPNPSSDKSTVNFTLTESGNVNVTVFDITGKSIQQISEQESFTQGEHKLEIDTKSIPSGVYFVTLTTGESSITRRLIVAH
ncbi:hypothetical protein BH09BAC5_BH09BAC5_21180 [soil metagenome]